MKGRVAVGAADWLIVEAIRAGHSTVPAIANYARVEQGAARDALNRMRHTGQVRRYGDKRGARYIVVNRITKTTSRRQTS